MPPKTKTAVAKMALKRQTTGKPPRLFKEMNELQRLDAKHTRDTKNAYEAFQLWRHQRDSASLEGEDRTGAVENAYGKYHARLDQLRTTTLRFNWFEHNVRNQVTQSGDDDVHDYPNHGDWGTVWEDMVEYDIAMGAPPLNNVP